MHYYREFIEISIPELPVRAVITNNQEEIITADAHLHSEMEMIRVLEGTITIHFNSHSLTLKKGELILINSMVVHSTTTPEDIMTKIFVLQFNPSSLYAQPHFSKYQWLLSFINQVDDFYHLFTKESKEPHKEIIELVDKIITEFTLKEISYDISIKAYLYRILSLLYRHNFLPLNMPSLKDNKDIFVKLEPIFQYTEIHYREEISVSAISDIVHFNYSYFCRLFKKATGRSYIEYLNYVRISIAEELLRTTNLPITAILEQTGYTSLSYFNRVFKHLKGVSPAVYRRHITAFL